MSIFLCQSVDRGVHGGQWQEGEGGRYVDWTVVLVVLHTTTVCVCVSSHFVMCVESPFGVRFI